MEFPTIDEVIAELKRIAQMLIDPEEGLDVRLQVYSDGDWAVRFGDPSYDTDHNGFWGASVLFSDSDDMRAVADDLLGQAKDDHAQA